MGFRGQSRPREHENRANTRWEEEEKREIEEAGGAGTEVSLLDRFGFGFWVLKSGFIYIYLNGNFLFLIFFNL